MAFKNIGMGARLTFDERKSVASMGRASRSFNMLNKSAMMAGRGVKWMLPSFRQLAIAGAAVVAVGGLMVKSYADFEQAMAGVKAVAVTATEPEFKEMTSLAKQLGATTKFTATESAEAMELFTRAGFNAREVMLGIPAVLSAAAAEGMGIAEAADISSNTLRIMGLEAAETARVVDVLALASAKSNTNMQMLGEAFRYGGAQARILGIPLEMTAAMFGKLADSGLKASVGGTSLTNMLIRMVKPSQTASKFMQKHNIVLTDTAGKFKPMPVLIDKFAKAISGISDEAKRSAMVQELFGIRGAKAYAAFASVGGRALQDLAGELATSEGAAKRMADIRMDTIAGQFTLLKSATEGFRIEIGEYLAPITREWTKNATDWIGNVATALRLLKEPGEMTGEQLKEWMKLTGSAREAAVSLTAAVKGIVGSMRDLATFMRSETFATMIDFVKWIGFGYKQIGKLGEVTKIPGELLEQAKLAVEARKDIAEIAKFIPPEGVTRKVGELFGPLPEEARRGFVPGVEPRKAIPAGQMGPLPVTPGATPPMKIVMPTPAAPPEVVIHTHVVLDGREIARAVDRVKANLVERAGMDLGAGGLRAIAEGGVI